MTDGVLKIKIYLRNIHSLTIERSANNSTISTYWERNGAFLKLKNAEIGYTFKSMRLYLRGSNLLTFSKFKLWDPEQGGGNG